MKDKSSPTSPPHGLHGAGIPASPHGRFIKPASTTSRPASAGPRYCFFKLVSITPIYFDISAGPGASPSLHQPTLDASASLADQLRHVSWTEGFASASQPLPASPYRRFIAIHAMGVRIESQFWESPFFGLLQQISQVLLILVFFAC